jgi:hypothetical protein
MPPPTPTSVIDTERFLLGACIRDGVDLPGNLRPCHFEEPALAQVANAVHRLATAGKGVDELTVSAFLAEIRGGYSTHEVNSLTAEVGFSVLNPSWGDAIIRASRLRDITRSAEWIAGAAQRGEDPDFLRVSFSEMLEKDDTLPAGAEEQKDASTEYFDLDAMQSFDPKADKTVLIGAERRWICQGYPFQIVGFSGTGKSSLAIHLGVHWALGRSPFGLKPVRELRVLMVQAENDFGDAAEAMMGATAKLTEPERRTLKENLVFVRQSSKMGFAFVEYLGQMVEKHKVDLIIADPLLAYANFDIADQEQTSAFLRGQGGVFEMLQRTKAALLYMHHTTKPKSADDLDAMTPQQLAYLGAGCAEWVNFARDSGYLFRTKANTSDGRPVYRFGFSKRQSRSGLKDAQDRFASHVNLCHAEDGSIRWEYAPPAMEDSPPSQKGHSSHAKGSPRPLDY